MGLDFENLAERWQITQRTAVFVEDLGSWATVTCISSLIYLYLPSVTIFHLDSDWLRVELRIGGAEPRGVPEGWGISEMGWGGASSSVDSGDWLRWNGAGWGRTGQSFPT